MCILLWQRVCIYDKKNKKEIGHHCEGGLLLIYRDMCLHNNFEENVTSDSSFRVSYAIPEVTIENVDFTTILPPQLNDVKRKDQLFETLKSLSSENAKERYRKLEELVLQAHQARDLAKFLKKHPALPHQLFSLNMYQQLVGLIVFIASKGRFDIQVHPSFLSQHCIMPTIEHFQQCLQVLKYLYTTRRSTYRYPKIFAEVSCDLYGLKHELITINIHTDASQQSKSSQGGYIILIDKMYITSRSFRLKPHSESSYECELLALREGINAGHTVKTTLYEMGYRNIQLVAYCDNLPVVDTANSRDKMKKSEMVYVNCVAAVIEHVRNGEVIVNHINGKTNPADMLTKTLPLTTLHSQLTGEYLNQAFQLIQSN